MSKKINGTLINKEKNNLNILIRPFAWLTNERVCLLIEPFVFLYWFCVLDCEHLLKCSEAINYRNSPQLSFVT